MKTRRHHNNKGQRQIRLGKTRDQVATIAEHVGVKTKHELTGFAMCTFGDGGYYYHDGFDRATCSCGWKSAPSRDHKALVALWDIHQRVTP